MAQEEAQYLFRVSDAVPAGVDDPIKARDPFIRLEPIGNDLSTLKQRNQSLGFRLRDGATQEEAEEVARFLNDHIMALTVW
mgnify:CR=1 FL=1